VKCEACLANVCFDATYNKVKAKGGPGPKGYLMIGDDVIHLHRSQAVMGHFDQPWAKVEYQVYDLETQCHTECGYITRKLHLQCPISDLGKQEVTLLSPTNCHRSWWAALLQDQQITNMRNVLTTMRNSIDPLLNQCATFLADKLQSKDRIYYQMRIVDFMYIPHDYIDQYTTIMRHFTQHEVISELATPNVLECLLNVTGAALINVPGINEEQPIRGNVLDNPEQYVLQAIEQDMTHIHPVKLGSIVKNLHGSRSLISLVPDFLMTLLFPAQQKSKCVLCDIIIPYIFN